MYVHVYVILKASVVLMLGFTDFASGDKIYYIYIYMYILKRTPIRAVCPLHQLLMMTMYKGLNALHACVATVCRFTFTLIQLILSMISSNGMKRFYRWLHINQRRSCELIKLLSTLYRVEMYAQFSFFSYLAWLFFRSLLKYYRIHLFRTKSGQS